MGNTELKHLKRISASKGIGTATRILEPLELELKLQELECGIAKFYEDNLN